MKRAEWHSSSGKGKGSPGGEPGNVGVTEIHHTISIVTLDV